MAFKFTKKTATKSSQTKNISEDELNKMIQERAYYIWLEMGKPTGKDLEIWLKAEKEIKSRFL